MLFVNQMTLDNDTIYAQENISSHGMYLFADPLKINSPSPDYSAPMDPLNPLDDRDTIIIFKYGNNSNNTKQSVSHQNDIINSNNPYEQKCNSILLPAVLQFIAIIIAFVALRTNSKQMQESNKQSVKAYDAFIQKSEKQFHAQQQVIKAQQQTIKEIREQSMRLEKKGQQIEMKNNFSVCYSLIWTIKDYVNDHFWDFLKRGDDYYSFLKDMLHPFVEAAIVLQLMPRSYYKNGFDAVLDKCAHLHEVKITNLEDMDELVANVDIISKGLEDQKQFFENNNI